MQYLLGFTLISHFSLTLENDKIPNKTISAFIHEICIFEILYLINSFRLSAVKHNYAIMHQSLPSL